MKAKWYQKTWVAILLLFIIPPAGLFFLLRNLKENKMAAHQTVLQQNIAQQSYNRTLESIEQITDLKELELIVNNDTDENIRIAALAQIADRQVLRIIAESNTSNKVRLAAFQKLNDRQGILYQQALGFKNGCKELYDILLEITDEDKLATLATRTVTHYDFDSLFAFLQQKNLPAFTASVVEKLFEQAQQGADSSLMLRYIEDMTEKGIRWTDGFTHTTLTYLCRHCTNAYHFSDYHTKIPRMLETIYAEKNELRDAVMKYNGYEIYCGSSMTLSGTGDNAGWYGLETPPLYVRINRLSDTSIKVCIEENKV